MLSRKTLILEDDPDLIFIFSSILQSSGYAVFSATTLNEAYTLLSEHQFELFLCDMNLGKESGIDLIHEHFDRFYADQTRIIGISAKEQHRTVCEDMGAEIFLSKPVRLNELVILIDQLGGTHQHPFFVSSPC